MEVLTMLQNVKKQDTDLESYLITEPTIRQFKILNEHGEIVNGDAEPKLSDSQLLELYKYMVFEKVAD